MHAIKYNKPKDPVQVYDGEIFKSNSRMRHIMGTNHFYCCYGSNYTNYGNQHNSRGLNKFTCWRTDVDDTRHESSYESWVWYTSYVIGEVPNMTSVARVLVSSRVKYMVVNSHRIKPWYRYDQVK